MFTRRILPLFVSLFLLLVLAACAGRPPAEPAAMVTGSNAEAGATMAEQQPAAGVQEVQGHNDDSTAEPAVGAGDAQMAESAAGEPGDMIENSGSRDLPTWQTVMLTDARTGEAFALADFQGKTVFVEPMATWCSNCRQQQGEVRDAKSRLGDEVLFVGLSLETNLPADQLAAYAESNGFDWTYAVMSTDLLRALSDEFGRGISSAPSTPHFIIWPDGTFSDLATGIHTADEIVAEIASGG